MRRVNAPSVRELATFRPDAMAQPRIRKYLLRAEKDKYLDENYSFSINSVDIETQSVTSGDVYRYKSHAHSRSVTYGIVEGFRVYNTDGNDQRVIAKVRILLPASSVIPRLANPESYNTYRDCQMYKSQPLLFRPEQELFLTDDYDIVTDRQIMEAEDVMLLEPKRMEQVMCKTYRARSFDKDTQLLKTRRLDLSTWFYVHRMVKPAANNKLRLGLVKTLENSTLKFAGPVIPCSYMVRLLITRSCTVLAFRSPDCQDQLLTVNAPCLQDLALWQVALVKFISAYHHPYQNSLKLGYWDQNVMELDIVHEVTGEERTITIPHGPKFWVATDRLKMVRMHMPGGCLCGSCYCMASNQCAHHPVPWRQWLWLASCWAAPSGTRR